MTEKEKAVIADKGGNCIEKHTQKEDQYCTFINYYGLHFGIWHLLCISYGYCFNNV